MTQEAGPRAGPPTRSRGSVRPRLRRIATRRPELALVALGAVLAWAAVLLLRPEEPVRVVLGLLLTTWLPGYAATAAIFGGRRVGGPDGVLVSLGLSVAVAILSGFVLNTFGVALSRETWAATLAIVTFAGVAIAWARSPSAIYQATPLRQGSLPRMRASDGVLLGAAVVLVVIAVALARNGVIQQPTPGFSSVWLVPNGAGPQFRVGAANHEGRPTAYRLVLTDPSGIVDEWPEVALRDGEQWEVSVAVRNSPSRLDLRLYLVDKPGSVYRSASWGVVPSADESSATP